jgi:hypothetical protein
VYILNSWFFSNQLKTFNRMAHGKMPTDTECALTLSDTGSSAATAADLAPHLAFLAKLVARDSNLGRVHVFTLNYDTLFEQALELLGIQYFDGFTGRADARFDPSVRLRQP